MTAEKPGSWLDKMAPRPLPPRELSPNLIFGFDDVMAVIGVGEAAMKEAQTEALRIQQERALKSAQDPFSDRRGQHIFGDMAVAMLKTELTFPMIFRRSLFCAVCAHVEHSLKRWCALLHGDWNLSPPPPKKPSGGAMAFTLMQYIHEIAGLAIGDFESWPEWTLFDTRRKARNCLEHDSGIIDDAGLETALEALGHIEIDRSGLLLDAPALIHLLPGACEAAALNGKMLFERLSAACQRDPRSKVTT